MLSINHLAHTNPCHRQHQILDEGFPANIPFNPNTDGMDVDQPGVGHPFFVETHPNTSQTHGNGRTFMGDFNADKWLHQLYYPFASRDKWELASFLLRSNLSMASIDKFLNLGMVSVPSGNIFGAEDSMWSHFRRSKSYICLFTLRKTCTAALRCYHLDHVGSANPGRQYIQQEIRSVCSTKICWSASRHFCIVLS